MKASVYPSTKPGSLPDGTDNIHLVRPLGTKKMSSLLKKNPGIHTISMSKSCSKRLSPKLKKLLGEKEIEMLTGNEHGRAISIPLERMLNVIEMRRDHRSLREIEDSTGVPKSTVHYLVKHSQKRKVKNGKNIIYLK